MTSATALSSTMAMKYVKKQFPKLSHPQVCLLIIVPWFQLEHSNRNCIRRGVCLVSHCLMSVSCSQVRGADPIWRSASVRLFSCLKPVIIKSYCCLSIHLSHPAHSSPTSTITGAFSESRSSRDLLLFFLYYFFYGPFSVNQRLLWQNPSGLAVYEIL